MRKLKDNTLIILNSNNVKQKDIRDLPYLEQTFLNCAIDRAYAEGKLYRTDLKVTFKLEEVEVPFFKSKINLLSLDISQFLLKVQEECRVFSILLKIGDSTLMFADVEVIETESKEDTFFCSLKVVKEHFYTTLAWLEYRPTQVQDLLEISEMTGFE